MTTEVGYRCGRCNTVTVRQQDDDHLPAAWIACHTPMCLGTALRVWSRVIQEAR